MLLIVCPLVFFASFVDSIAGGGGLISLPAYMLTGLPMHTVFGCNKVSAGIGTTFAAIKFYKSGKMQLKNAALCALFALGGAGTGAAINMQIQNDLLKKAMLVLLPVIAVLMLFGGKKRTAAPPRIAPTKRKRAIIYALIGFVIGLYDGLIGPGTGTMMMIGFTAFAGCDYVTASGNAKLANLASNVASAIVYMRAGEVIYPLALTASVFAVAGGLLGSSLAIKKGSGLIRVMIFLVLLGILFKLVWDMKIF